jgi:hypothetical protein
MTKSKAIELLRKKAMPLLLALALLTGLVPVLSAVADSPEAILTAPAAVYSGESFTVTLTADAVIASAEAMVNYNIALVEYAGGDSPEGAENLLVKNNAAAGTLFLSRFGDELSAGTAVAVLPFTAKADASGAAAFSVANGAKTSRSLAATMTALDPGDGVSVNVKAKPSSPVYLSPPEITADDIIVTETTITSAVVSEEDPDAWLQWGWGTAEEVNWAMEDRAPRTFGPTITDLEPNTEYYVWARFVSSDESLYYTSDVCADILIKTLPPALEAPVLSEVPAARTATAIRLASPAVSGQDEDATPEYRKSADGDEYGAWQTSATFTGLAADTQYWFQARYTANATWLWNDSEASDAVQIRTSQASDMFGVVIGVFDNGSVVADMDSVAQGTLVTLTVTPDNGYWPKAGSLAVTGANSSATVPLERGDEPNTYTFIMPAEDVTVTAEFVVAMPHTITLVSTSNLPHLLKSNKATALVGETVGITVYQQSSSSPGYRAVLDSFSVTALSDGEIPAIRDPSNIYTYTFVMPDEAVTVSVAHERFYVISAEQYAGGNISFITSPTDETGVHAAEGELVTVTFKVAESCEYVENSLTVTGTGGATTPVIKLDDATYTFPMPASDVYITAEFKFPGGARPEWEGLGTEASPYLIQSNEDMIKLRTAVNGGVGMYYEDMSGPGEEFDGVHFLLTENLDLTTSEENWLPIGCLYVKSFSPIAMTSLMYFSGVFDGGGHTINLNCEDFPGMIRDGGKGLFLAVQGGTIRNLELTGNMSAEYSVAAFAVQVVDIKIVNPSEVPGRSKGSSLIENCVNRVNMTGSHLLSGFVEAASNLTIKNSVNYGNITEGFKGSVHGFVSKGLYAVYIIDCINYGNITAAGSLTSAYGFGAGITLIKDCANYGDIRATAIAYGFGSGSGLTIEDSYNAGAITGSRFASGIGGFDTIIRNCYNTGTVISKRTSDVGYATGIAFGSGSKVYNSYNAGSVSGMTTEYVAAIGVEGTISNSYYLDTSSAKGGAGAVAVTSAELKALAETLGDAFRENPDGGYPILAWQAGVVNNNVTAASTVEAGVVTATIKGAELDAHMNDEGDVAVAFNLVGGVPELNATIKNATLKAMAAASASLKLTTDAGELAFNSVALRETAEAAGTNDVLLTAKKLGGNTYEYALTAAGAAIFADGKNQGAVAVTLPYTRSRPATEVSVKVFRLGESSEKTDMKASYVSGSPGSVSFEMDRFGVYAIEEAERPVANPGEPGASGNPTALVWDGETIDLSWYNPAASEYHISYPAELAGLAAIVNGIYNEDIRYIFGDEKYIVNNVVEGASSGGGNMTTGTYHYGADDFNGKIVYLDANINMGAGNNYMPIGGQYLMAKNDYSTKLSSSFCGTLDGQGHSVTIYADRHCSTGNYGDGASVGLIGRLGVHDGDAAELRPTNPTVKNLAVYGSVRGNRHIGGVVGKIGKTAYNNGNTSGGAIIESCANFASISSTDSKGIGGIVGASWNGGTIRNCYNAGQIAGGTPAGGIAGSNEIRIENCYNVGTISSSNGKSYAMAIGSFNGDFGHSVEKAYYLKDSAPGGGYFGGGYSGGDMTAAEMKSEEFLDLLGEEFAQDVGNINSGYPVLKWQSSGRTGDTGNLPEPDANDNETTAPGTTTVKDDSAVTIVDEPVALGSDPTLVVINVETDGAKVNSITAEVTAENVKAIADNGSAIEVRSDLGNVTLPSAAVKDLAGKSEEKIDVKLTKNSADTYTLALTADDKAVATVGGGVKLTLPSEDTTPGTVAVIVHADGTEEVIKKSVGKDGKVSVPLDGSATVKIINNAKTFSDVTDDAWYFDGVKFTSSHELFQGDEGKFSPNASMTRGMLVTVLHRLENAPNAIGDLFSDVDSGAYYAEAIIWASANSIVNGTGNGFAPDTEINREQLAVMLYRYYVWTFTGDGGRPGTVAPTDANLSAFPDADGVSDWASDAVIWSVGIGLINGRDSGLAPKGTATRAEVAVILERFIENIL